MSTLARYQAINNAITAKTEAPAITDRQITLQANMLAFSRIYWLSGLVLIVALPLLLLLRTGRVRGPIGPVQ